MNCADYDLGMTELRTELSTDITSCAKQLIQLIFRFCIE